MNMLKLRLAWHIHSALDDGAILRTQMDDTGIAFRFGTHDHQPCSSMTPLPTFFVFFFFLTLVFGIVAPNMNR